MCNILLRNTHFSTNNIHELYREVTLVQYTQYIIRKYSFQYMVLQQVSLGATGMNGVEAIYIVIFLIRIFILNINQN